MRNSRKKTKVNKTKKYKNKNNVRNNKKILNVRNPNKKKENKKPGLKEVIYVGDTVRVVQTFVTDANINGPLKEGTTLVVKKANKDGSLSVSNGFWTKFEIIKRKNFDKVEKIKNSAKQAVEKIKKAANHSNALEIATQQSNFVQKTSEAIANATSFDEKFRIFTEYKAKLSEMENLNSSGTMQCEDRLEIPNKLQVPSNPMLNIHHEKNITSSSSISNFSSEALTASEMDESENDSYGSLVTYFAEEKNSVVSPTTRPKFQHMRSLRGSLQSTTSETFSALTDPIAQAVENSVMFASPTHQNLKLNGIEEKQMEMTVKAGSLGLKVKPGTGQITHIFPNAQKCFKKLAPNEWRILTVEGQPYNRRLLLEKLTGVMPYDVVLTNSPPENFGSSASSSRRNSSVSTISQISLPRLSEPRLSGRARPVRKTKQDTVALKEIEQMKHMNTLLTHRLRTIEMSQRLEIEILKQEKFHYRNQYKSQISMMENTLRETKSDLHEKTEEVKTLQEKEKKIPEHIYNDVNFLNPDYKLLPANYVPNSGVAGSGNVQYNQLSAENLAIHTNQTSGNQGFVMQGHFTAAGRGGIAGARGGGTIRGRGGIASPGNVNGRSGGAGVTFGRGGSATTGRGGGLVSRGGSAAPPTRGKGTPNSSGRGRGRGGAPPARGGPSTRGNGRGRGRGGSVANVQGGSTPNKSIEDTKKPKATIVVPEEFKKYVKIYKMFKDENKVRNSVTKDGLASKMSEVFQYCGIKPEKKKKKKKMRRKASKFWCEIIDMNAEVEDEMDIFLELSQIEEENAASKKSKKKGKKKNKKKKQSNVGDGENLTKKVKKSKVKKKEKINLVLNPKLERSVQFFLSKLKRNQIQISFIRDALWKCDLKRLETGEGTILELLTELIPEANVDWNANWEPTEYIAPVPVLNEKDAGGTIDEIETETETEKSNELEMKKKEFKQEQIDCLTSPSKFFYSLKTLPDLRTRVEWLLMIHNFREGEHEAFLSSMKAVLNAVQVVSMNPSFKKFLNILFRICTSSASYKENIKNGLKLRHLSGMHYKKLPDGRTYLQFVVQKCYGRKAYLEWEQDFKCLNQAAKIDVGLFQKTAGQHAGTVKRMQKHLNDYKKNHENLQETHGDGFIPFFETFVKVFTEFTEEFQQIWQQLEQSVKDTCKELQEPILTEDQKLNMTFVGSLIEFREATEKIIKQIEIEKAKQEKLERLKRKKEERQRAKTFGHSLGFQGVEPDIWLSNKPIDTTKVYE